MDNNKPLIAFQDVSFSYDGARPVLEHVDLNVFDGEFLSVVGSNGSGKTTLALLIDALLTPDSGKVEVFGYDTSEKASLFPIRSNIGYVLQDPDDQIVSSLVYDEIAFGPCSLGLAEDEVKERVNEALDKLELVGYREHDVNTLSGGLKQRVAIAGALAMRPSLLILDEPTSMLDGRSSESLLDLLDALNESGLTIILITHRKDEIERTQRLIEIRGHSINFDGVPNRQKVDGLFPPKLTRGVLRNEEIADSAIKHPLSPDESLRIYEHTESRNGLDEITAHLLASIGNAGGSQASGMQSDAAIELKDVSFAYDDGAKGAGRRKGRDKEESGNGHSPIFENIDFTINHREFVTIMGRNGSGKSTLVKLMNGLLQPDKGEVFVEGKKIETRSDLNFARNNVGLCFQYPERQLFETSVYDDIAYGPRQMGLDEAEIEVRVLDSISLLDIGNSLLDKSPFLLSGGQMRKVAIAGVLAMKPKTIILDEPCASLDPKSRNSLIELLAGIHASGQTIILITHDTEEARLLSDRIFLLKKQPASA